VRELHHLTGHYLARGAGAHLPPGLLVADVSIVGVAVSIGSTVALFFLTAVS
jgi:hypothetical protein